jgi:hypothetical protein
MASLNPRRRPLRPEFIEGRSGMHVVRFDTEAAKPPKGPRSESHPR